MLDYLARYVFRVALTNARIVGLDDQTVSIQYKERKTGRPRTCRLSGDEFMRRFLQHVLPRGFHKVRYFGLWHPAQRHNATRVIKKFLNSQKYSLKVALRKPAASYIFLPAFIWSPVNQTVGASIWFL